MHSHRRFGVGITVAAALLSVAPLAAGTLYHVVGGSDGFAIGPCNGTDASGLTTSVTSASPAVSNVSCSGVTGTLTSSASSGPGHLGASLMMNTSPSTSGSVEADFITQVTFSTLDQNAPQDPVAIALNMDINGFMTLLGSGVIAWSASAQLGSTVFSHSTSIDGTEGVNNFFFSSGGDTLVPNVSDTVAGTLTTPTINGVGLNTPIFIKLTFSLFGFANPGQVDGEFLNSLDFPSGKDVFILPAGVTANAPDIFLVNNRFLPPSTGVPEPSAWLPLGVSMAGLAWNFRRRASTR
jgi:hypothetical protein